MKDVRPTGSAVNSDGTDTGADETLPSRFYVWEDWLAALVTFFISGAVFFYYMSPTVTLQDSGELVTGAYRFGVPHPPGYPLWAFLGWVWRHLVPWGNPAWRIGLFSVVTGAALVALTTVLMKRTVLVLLRESDWAAQVDEALRRWIAATVGLFVGLMFAFNRGVWLWASVPEMRVLSVFMFMLTTFAFFHWMQQPERRGRLYLTLLIYGLGASNHQTILVMAPPLMAGALAVGLQQLLRTWRSPMSPGKIMPAFHALWGLTATAFLATGVVFLIRFWLDKADLSGSLLQRLDQIGSMIRLWLNKPGDASPAPHLVLGVAAVLTGLGLLVVFGQWRWLQRRVVLLCTGAFLLGGAVYLYMPIAASTNPPMNWGFTATREGFLHHITRGQYQQLNFVSPFSADFWTQIAMFVMSLFNQYTGALCLFALFSVVILGLWWGRLSPRGRSWLFFLWVAFLTSGLLLMAIINPSMDRQNWEIVIKFFAPAHGFFALLIGCGMALLLAELAQWRSARRWIRYGALAAVLLAAVLLYFFPLVPRWSYRLQAAVCIVPCLVIFAAAQWGREYTWLRVVCLLLLLLPVIPYRRNWEGCEKRNHEFGYQFGFRMFYPGGGYPPMEKDAFLYGGTDPGRFVPTYMIFSESFALPADRYQSPYLDRELCRNFDRRDVYIVTQNALADSTYMSYIRDHYDFSRPDLTHPETIKKFLSWQRRVFAFGWQRMGRDRTYPRAPIHIPSPAESNQAFQQYLADIQSGRIPAGADVKFENGRVSIQGVQGVMAVNGILAKWIFDRNKDQHEFYIEESYVIPWMYPHLSPYGVIMKINHEPLPTPQEQPMVWQEIWNRDSAYWNRLCAEFKGRPEFARDVDGPKAFSKLRSAIAGIYEYRRMWDKAELAYRQAISLYPASPEASFRLANMYLQLGLFDPAIEALTRLRELDPLNVQIARTIEQFKFFKQQHAQQQRKVQPQQAPPLRLPKNMPIQ
ncbi:MAG: DUF2723 domain-containing protein [Kiritimatiellaeota bacterium]|nr:DUF2723 domain-containing protein [Kiritimatiellota bacterium]